MKFVLTFVWLAAALAVPSGNALSSLAQEVEHTLFNSGAYALSYVESKIGNELYKNHRAVIFLPEEAQHFVYDLFSGKQLFSIDRPLPTATSLASGAENLLLSLFEDLDQKCINSDLGNPESGICSFHSCSVTNSDKCNSSYYDCCTFALRDYNGRYECSNAICVDTSSISGTYTDGGCCSASGDSIAI